MTSLLRDKILTEENKTPKSHPVKIFGIPVLLREPTYGDVADYRDRAQGNEEEAGLMLLTAFCFDPNNPAERVFMDEDVATLKEMPIHGLQEALMALQKIIGQPTEEDTKNSDATP